MELDSLQIDAAFVIKDMQNSFHLSETLRNERIRQLIEEKELTIEELSANYERSLNLIRKEYEVKELIREKSVKTIREGYEKEIEVLTSEFNHYRISKNSLTSWLEEYLTSLTKSKLSKKEIKTQLRNIVRHLEQRQEQQP